MNETRRAFLKKINGTAVPVQFVGKPEDYPADLPDKEVRRRFLKVLGRFEKPLVPLNLRVTDETELAGGIVRQRVEYDVAPGETVPAFHLFAQGLPRRAPAILSIHAHGGGDIFPVGKAYHSRPDRNDPMQYSYQAALAGFRVLAPDALCFGERQAAWGYSTLFFDEIVRHAELCARGQSLAWKSVWDNSRAVEALESLGAAAIGTIGLSGGSTQAYILTAVNAKIRAAACFSSFATLRHQYYQYRLAHCLYHYLPGMVTAGIDWDQVVALAAPRKFYFYRGGKDEGTPEVMCRAFVEAIRRRCRQQGLPDAVTLREVPDGEHPPTQAVLTEALDFLKANVVG